MIIYYKNGDGEVETYEPNEMDQEQLDDFIFGLSKSTFVFFEIGKKSIILNTKFIVQIELHEENTKRDHK